MTSYGEVERELAVLLRRARVWSRDIAREVHPDLPPTAYTLLSRIDEQGSLRASDLADYFGIDKGAVSRQVQLLEQLSLVDREPDPDDGRAQRLVVTEEGRDRIGRARGGRRRVVREQLHRWPEADVAALALLLARFNAQMDVAFGRGPEDRPD